MLMARFFYHAYITSSDEHLPVSFLAALVILVLGTQQTAMSLRKERHHAASLVTGCFSRRIPAKIGYTTLAAVLSVAFLVLLVILQHHLT
jgi:hypothetical protein